MPVHIPDWLNRENIQLTLIVLITMGVHYYFINARIQAQVDETISQMEAEDAAKASSVAE